MLVLGWGNRSRGDDALGPMFVSSLSQQLPDWLGSRVEFLEDYQLQVEHALDIVGRQHVLFVDASVSAPAPYQVTAVHPAVDASFTTHSLSPQALLQVYQNLRSEPPPPCTLLAIRGENFELGQPPSADALNHLAGALAWAKEMYQSAI
jgi:hydrogenase maturation protease